MARVLIRFRDVETWALYDVGDEWDGPPERLEKLVRGGYVQERPSAHAVAGGGPEGPPDALGGVSADMTVAQLREVAEGRGIDVPRRATKARLLEILGA